MNNWSIQEDQLLLEFTREYSSYKKWKKISQRFGLLGIKKTAYECRQRFINKLDQNITSQKWNREQYQILFQNYNAFGSQWRIIQLSLKNRTQVQIKNAFYIFLRSLLMKLLKQLKLKLSYVSSTILKNIYQGNKEFSSIQGRFKRYLFQLDYEIQSKSIHQFAKNNKEEIKEIYVLIKKTDLCSKNIKKINIEEKRGNENSQIKSINRLQKNKKIKDEQYIPSYNRMREITQMDNINRSNSSNGNVSQSSDQEIGQEIQNLNGQIIYFENICKEYDQYLINESPKVLSNSQYMFNPLECQPLNSTYGLTSYIPIQFQYYFSQPKSYMPYYMVNNQNIYYFIGNNIV